MLWYQIKFLSILYNEEMWLLNVFSICKMLILNISYVLIYQMNNICSCKTIFSLINSHIIKNHGKQNVFTLL